MQEFKLALYTTLAGAQHIERWQDLSDGGLANIDANNNAMHNFHAMMSAYFASHLSCLWTLAI